MPARFYDPRSVAGKNLHVAEGCDLLVIGAGPAGLAAAIEGAQHGLSVVLVDENPVPFATMGDDIPLHFGQGMDGQARNRNAMMEAYVASEPMIEAAFEAGVDVRLGAAVHGLWGNGPSVGWLPGLVAGLGDEERSWLLGAGRVIVAAGARDVGLAFPGWEKPGVLGAIAAARLARRYGALAARRAVVLGTGHLALGVAEALAESGVEIAALVEAAEGPVGPAERIAALERSGVEILCGQVVREAAGRDRVEAALVGSAGGGSERRLDCDAIVLAIGATPVVELLDGLGCRIAFQAERGGYAPVLGAAGATSVPGVYAVGDAAGIWAEKLDDRAIAEAEGRRAAAHAAGAAGPSADGEAAGPGPLPAGHDPSAYRLAWVRASVVEARAEPYVCQCEEVTAREILEVRPPRYLDAKPDRRNDRTLASLLGEGPPNPDQVKRLTRAGMGTCQGRRCREQVACLLALGAGTPLAEVPLAGYRAPVRPLPLRLAGDTAEPEEMRAHWDTWFGIAAQYRLPGELPPRYTVAGRPQDIVDSE